MFRFHCIFCITDSHQIVFHLYGYSYRQCLPSRFRKEVMKAAMTDPSKADRIDMNGLRRVFANIGAIEQISEDEIQLIFEELGNDVGEIDIPRFKLLVCPR